MIYSQTDKMKMLKSQKLYADVISTRFEQIDKKGAVKEQEFAIEQKFHEDLLIQLEKADRVEEEKILKIKKQIDEIKVTRKQQLDETKRKKEETEKISREEGQRLRQEAKERYEEDLRQQEARQQMVIANNLKTLRANGDLKTVKERLRKEEEDKLAAREAEAAVIEKRKNDLKSVEKVFLYLSSLFFYF